MSKRSLPIELKLEIVQEHLNTDRSIHSLVAEYKVSKDSIKKWIYNYQTYGVEGLTESKSWKNYSDELKLHAVQEYLEGKSGLRQITLKYKISDDSVLRRWIKRYTSGKNLNTTSKGLNTMNQGRKTTIQERIEIVNFTLAHNKDYQAAVENYHVSYQQVYSWVRKFEKDGMDGLEDRRGKTLKTKSNLTSEEEMTLKIKALEERNRFLEMELGLLKKLDEIERRNRR